MKDITSRNDIQTLVDTFYKKLLKDDIIGYFFTDVVQINWKHHMPKMYDFWETTLFHKALYKGNPIPPHSAIHQAEPITKVHFDHWVAVFQTTVDELFEGEKATMAKQRAQSIATVMQLKIN